jgi:hypothetical protein
MTHHHLIRLAAESIGITTLLFFGAHAVAVCSSAGSSAVSTAKSGSSIAAP